MKLIEAEATYQQKLITKLVHFESGVVGLIPCRETLVATAVVESLREKLLDHFSGTKNMGREIVLRRTVVDPDSNERVEKVLEIDFGHPGEVQFLVNATLALIKIMAGVSQDVRRVARIPKYLDMLVNFK